jgi:hypothetical protein
MILLILSGILFFGYVGAMYFVNGGKFLPSISESWYVLTAKSHLLGSIFTLWCFAIAFLQIGLLLDIAEGHWFQFTGFLTAAGLGFVGAAPMFKGHERTIHRTGAGFAAGFSLLFSSLLGYYNIDIAAVILLGLTLGVHPEQRKNYIFWGEFFCFSALFIVELLYIVQLCR